MRTTSNKDVSGFVWTKKSELEEGEEHWNATLELNIPTHSGDAFNCILIGVGFVCGEDNIRLSYSIRNKTDNITIEAGTIMPGTAQVEGLCNVGVNVYGLSASKGIEIMDGVELISGGCQTGSTHKPTFHLGQLVWVRQEHFVMWRTYRIKKAEWMGKTMEFKLWDPSQTNSKRIAVGSGITTSMFVET